MPPLPPSVVALLARNKVTKRRTRTRKAAIKMASTPWRRLSTTRSTRRQEGQFSRSNGRITRSLRIRGSQRVTSMDVPRSFKSISQRSTDGAGGFNETQFLQLRRGGNCIALIAFQRWLLLVHVEWPLVNCHSRSASVFDRHHYVQRYYC